jgi:hypothetical protein
MGQGKLRKVGRFTFMAVVAASAWSCSSEPGQKPAASRSDVESDSGKIGLSLMPVSGVIINTVSYKVTRGVAGPLVKSGSVPVPGLDASFSFGLSLPTGTGYVLSLEAVSVDGKVVCAGSAGPFDILANQTAQITPTLTCVDISTGQTLIDVDVVTTACPDITFDYVLATPSAANVGQTISLFSSAVSASATPLTYSWQIAAPAVGSFTNPLLKDAQLKCNADGQNVVVKVTASNGECTKSLSTKVSCANVLCGDGVVGPEESCDKALDPTCPADCIIECGDGIVEGTETCEPPNGVTCSATCSLIPIVCGDGVLSPGEICDWSANPTGAPAGVPCESTCMIAPIVHCGDGFIGAGETCDPLTPYTVDDCGGPWGPATAPAGGGRDNDCTPITPAACLSCENASECAELVGTALLSGNATEGPAQGVSRKALYNEVLDCVHDTHCASGLIVDCYCGTVSSSQCDAGNGNGACRASIERGVETTNPSDVQARLTNLTLGGGLAMARVACDQNNCTQCL